MIICREYVKYEYLHIIPTTHFLYPHTQTGQKFWKLNLSCDIRVAFFTFFNLIKEETVSQERKITHPERFGEWEREKH